MSFQSYSFLLFLPLTAAACLLAGRRSRRAGEVLLLCASWLFYLGSFTAHAWAGFAVLTLSACLTRLAVRFLGPEARHRRAVFAAAAVWQVAVLLVFKYTGFFSGGRLSLGWSPLGLSFFTFQQLWFLKEVYTGQFAPDTDGTGGFLLFSFFFPTVSSGPILKPESFFPQLREEGFLHPAGQDAAAALYAISMGMMKKVLLADSLGAIVNNGYAHPEALTAPEAWLVILGYTLQLYFDFSGYCDIAAGAARLLGIRLPVNFDSPYRSLSIGEFWKRWHITLTSFLRECVYFPLGGSRKGTARTYLNILLIFLISGFWHGAGWTFILWGLLHGLAQVIERALGPRRALAPKWLQWLVTFGIVNGAWVLFRAPSVGVACRMVRTALRGGMYRPGEWLFTGMLTSEREALTGIFPSLSGVLLPVLVTVLYGVGMAAAVLPGNTIRRMDRFRPTFWRAALLAAALAWCVLSFGGKTTFIYSNF